MVHAPADGDMWHNIEKVDEMYQAKLRAEQLRRNRAARAEAQPQEREGGGYRLLSWHGRCAGAEASCGAEDVAELPPPPDGEPWSKDERFWLEVVRRLRGGGHLPASAPRCSHGRRWCRGGTSSAPRPWCSRSGTATDCRPGYAGVSGRWRSATRCGWYAGRTPTTLPVRAERGDAIHVPGAAEHRGEKRREG